MTNPDQIMMQAAIEIADATQTPFGAALAMGDQLFVTAVNQTEKHHDPTAHAEITAIRKLAGHLQKTDLSGFTLYTTCEPCPMCMSAVILAKIEKVVFGIGIPEVLRYRPQIKIRVISFQERSFYPIDIIGDVCRDECLKLLKKYS